MLRGLQNTVNVNQSIESINLYLYQATRANSSYAYTYKKRTYNPVQNCHTDNEYREQLSRCWRETTAAEVDTIFFNDFLKSWPSQFTQYKIVR